MQLVDELNITPYIRYLPLTCGLVKRLKYAPLWLSCDLFSLSCLRENTSARDKIAAKITTVVSSTEFCQEIFDERDVRECLGGRGGHRAIIPLVWS